MVRPVHTCKRVASSVLEVKRADLSRVGFALVEGNV
jgi:hypothetical protein